jgi:hypothetical protein
MPSTLIFTSLFFVFGSSCTRFIQNFDDHQNLSSQIPTSEMTYRGLVKRNIGLKFNVEKTDKTEITAQIELPQNYSEPLNYKWMLGKDVTLEYGNLSGEITNYEKNKPLFLKIIVQGFNNQTTKHIRFEIESKKMQQRIFADGIVSNHTENSFEKIVQEVEQYKKENDL